MTILNETTELIQKGYTWGTNLSSGKFWFLLISGLVIVGLFAWILFDNLQEKIGLKIFCIGMVLFGLLSVMTAFHTKPVYKEVKQYEVTINSLTPFHMIYDNYDIIEQRDKIFVLRDKGWENND